MSMGRHRLNDGAERGGCALGTRALAGLLILVAALPLRADYVETEGGTRTQGDSIMLDKKSREYVVTDMKTGVSVRQPASKVTDVSVAMPAGLDRAKTMVADPSTYEQLVPVLEKIVESHSGLRWDIQAGYLLAQVYEKQSRWKDLIAMADKIVRYSRASWVPAEFHKFVLTALVQDGQFTVVDAKVNELMKSGHPPTIAMACLVRGDSLMKKGQFKEALLEGYFRVLTIHEKVKGVQAEAIYKSIKCLDSLRDPRADKLRQMLAEKYPDSEWAQRLGG